MNEVFADGVVARRVEQAWACTAAESARSYGLARPEAGVAVASIGGGTAVFLGQGSPLSQAQGLGCDGPVAEADLDRLQAFFSARGVATSIEVSSLADPGLLPALSRRGFLIAEQTHMLLRALQPDADAGCAGSSARGVAVEQVTGGEEAAKAAWADTVLRGFFEGPDEPPGSICEVIAAMTAPPGPTCWLARVDGVPAGGASMTVQQGLALCAGDATLPSFRRRGVQAALIAARLAEAARAGCELAVACTNPGSISQRNFERLGFRLAYARTLMVHEPAPVL
jgi:GNAT superfamily N-acetyltransferase